MKEKMLKDIEKKIDDLNELIEIKESLLHEACEKDYDDMILSLSNEISRLQNHKSDLLYVLNTLKGC